MKTHSFVKIAPLLVSLLFASVNLSVGAAEELLEFKPTLRNFDDMYEQRLVRVLVIHNKMMFFLDKGTKRGATHDLFVEFEKALNSQFDLKTRKIHVVFLPVPRNQLLSRLVEGYGDIAAGNLTITDERLALVDFSDPLLTGVQEQLVTGPASAEITTRDDLAGKTIHVRKSSSYFSSLEKLNQDFQARDLEPIELVAADENLEDNDLLEMVNAGLIPMIIVDSHKAAFWQDIFDDIDVHTDINVREGGEIAVAIRKDSPKLEEILNAFVKEHKKGSLLGNILFKRYLKENKWVKNAANKKELKKYYNMIALFTQYGDQYAFDPLMLAALGYQESGLDHGVRSGAGAIGVMQLLQSTAEDKNVGIADIHELESNIHAGSKYLRFLRDRYFADPEIDDLNKTLMAFASYNAGPAKISKLRKKAAEMGLDPNIWFGNVEIVSAEVIGRETTHYVSNIYKYYVAYKLVEQQHLEREQAINSMQDD
jgi:membrane-bound lytic murein transglycosylase MltF